VVAGLIVIRDDVPYWLAAGKICKIDETDENAVVLNKLTSSPVSPVFPLSPFPQRVGLRSRTKQGDRYSPNARPKALVEFAA
jgi:hypothetical protein